MALLTCLGEIIKKASKMIFFCLLTSYLNILRNNSFNNPLSFLLTFAFLSYLYHSYFLSQLIVNSNFHSVSVPHLGGQEEISLQRLNANSTWKKDMLQKLNFQYKHNEDEDNSLNWPLYNNKNYNKNSFFYFSINNKQHIRRSWFICPQK